MSSEIFSGPRRVRLEVSKRALLANFAKIAERVAPCRILTVLKADAYHLGAKFVAQVAREAGAFRIGAADLNEALELQEASGLDVQILGAVMPWELETAVAQNIVMPLPGIAFAREVSREAVKQNKTVRCAVVLDTDMGRFGLLPDNYLAEITAMKALPNLNLEGIYSHFPMAGEVDDPGSQAQIAQFKCALKALETRGVTFELRHIAATDGMNCQTGTTCDPFNMVRLGHNWYGVEEERSAALGLVPVLRLTTVVGAVREMPAGHNIGYKRLCTLKRKTRVATICAGYADGLPLALSNQGRVLIHGVSCPILGRLSMDYTMVDVSNVPGEVTWGTPVTLLGAEGKEHIGVLEYAAFKGTHLHDILCAIGPRVEHVYTE